ncbi:MAG: glycosyltransferase [Candidatus Brocadiaceae bacterium]|nr:glycosyltransferase [Candidatus Brocadiaceae bacterium]
MKQKLLYVGMRYDYGDKARGFSFEHRNFYHPLKSYSEKHNWDFVHFDFMEQGLNLGLDLMTQNLYELAKRERPTCLFAVLFDFNRDPCYEVFKQISSLGTVTVHWFCDDHWRFEKYSSVVAPHFDVICTTANDAIPKYKNMGISHKVLKTQWACNHELYIPYDIPKDIEMSFVGQPHGNRVEVLSKLLQNGYKLEVFGFGWENRPRIPFHQMVRIFSRSKINLNLSNSSTLIGQQIKGRNFEIPGTRSFQLSSNADNLKDYYEEEKEIVIFNSVDELIEKAKYYLKNEDERNEIATNGYKRTITEHTWQHRFETIFNYMNLKQINTNIAGKSILNQNNDAEQTRTIQTSEPLVSVIIPCYNQANFLPEAVESVVNQNYKNWECIIVNDGSSDNTTQVAKSLIKKYSDNQIQLINQVNQGLSCARNAGIKVSKGKFILPLDADDLVHSEMLKKTVALLEAQSEIAIAYTDVKQFGSANQIICADEYDFNRLRFQNHLNYCSLYRRKAWESAGGYNLNMTWGYEDWDFWISCGKKGHYGKRIPEPLFLYRVKERSMYTKALEHHQELMAQIVLNHPNLYDSKSLLEAKRILSQDYTIPLKNNPLVSVIVPTFNRPDTLKVSLESIASQTYKHIEVVVVNDAGEDVSAVVDLFHDRLSIQYLVHSENKGLAAARNTAIRHASGEYIAYLDDDDRFYQDHIETLVTYLETHEDKVAYTDAFRVCQEKENGRYIVKQKDVPYSFDFDSDLILAQNLFPVLCIMHKKSCLDEVGFFDESLTTHEDWDLWIRMSRKYHFAHIPKITAEFTWRADSTCMSGEKRADFLRTLNIIYERYGMYSKGKQRVLHLQIAWIKQLQKASIIIPVFNKVEFTQKCLEAIIKNTPGELYEVIIIDNASTDGTGEYLKSLEGDIKIIVNNKNLGFSMACNQGAQMASTDYLLFLNNDTEPQKGWLEPLLNILTQDGSVGAVGAKLLFPDGTIQHAGVVIINDQKLPDPLVARHICYGEPGDAAEANQLRQYQALTGACLLMRKSAFTQAGGFDENYWNGYEDVDLCFKLQEKGWKLVYQPESVVTHHESKSGPERFSKVSENIQRLHGKWIGKIKPDIIIREDGSTIITENNKIQRYHISNTISAGSLACKPRSLVSIIILTYNALKYTQQCVSSIQQYTNYPHEIIFVDNASTDGTVEYLRNQVREHTNCKLIENHENNGFSAGNNQGVSVASGDYVMLLNNDVLVADGWLDNLVDSLERSEKIGMVGPITNSISGRQMVKDIPYTDENGFHCFAQKIRKAYNGRLTPRYRIAGFAILMKKSLYEEVGGLDESFGTGNYEDDDLCLKVRKKGFAIMVDESVFIHHYRSKTFLENQIDYQDSISVNGSRFREKWPDVDYDELLELHKSLVDLNASLLVQGQEALNSGNTDGAIALYSKILTTNPIDEFALYGIGCAFEMKKKTSEAMDAYKEALKANPNVFSVYYSLALMYAGMNQTEDAISALKKAVELNSKDATVYNNLGVLYFKNNKHIDARMCFEKALSIDVNYQEAQRNLKKVS